MLNGKVPAAEAWRPCPSPAPTEKVYELQVKSLKK